MTSIDRLIDEIVNGLKELADKKRKDLAKTYYPTKMEIIGVTVPDVRKIIKIIQPEIKELSSPEKTALCQKLVNTNIFECQQIAYEIIGRDKKLLNNISSEDIRNLDKNQDNWVSVDTYSALILGVGWRLGKISDEEILKRAKSENFWKRRQALVATLGWNQKARGGTGNTKKTIMVCELFIDDHEDMINKALSWALRELSKVDKQAVIDFMQKHEARLNKRVKREVSNKLITGLKN